jgi:pilus assembly protein Flp/PilA
MTGSDRSTRWSARRFRKDEQGATAIEYALIASGVGMAIITTVFGVGSQLQTGWYAKISAIFN